MKEKIEKLKQFDTPSITNVVATYPNNKESCLGLYNPWDINWYADQTLKCMYPELGRVAGYVVTCVYGLPDPNYNRLGLSDVIKAIAASPKPVILAVKQNFPDNIKGKIGLMGGNMMTAFKAAGCVGVLSDGPSRDIDEIRPMGIQYMLTGATAGHGAFSVHAINVPVNICGMDVTPGEIVHMDENGACKFPSEYIDEVIDRASALQKVEAARMEKMAKESDPEEILKIMRGLYD
jgi:4-hydroxy-4-methyl-2-oxoglutarate aldolase